MLLLRLSRVSQKLSGIKEGRCLRALELCDQMENRARTHARAYCVAASLGGISLHVCAPSIPQLPY